MGIFAKKKAAQKEKQLNDALIQDFSYISIQILKEDDVEIISPALSGF